MRQLAVQNRPEVGVHSIIFCSPLLYLRGDKLIPTAAFVQARSFGLFSSASFFSLVPSNYVIVFESFVVECMVEMFPSFFFSQSRMTDQAALSSFPSIVFFFLTASLAP